MAVVSPQFVLWGCLIQFLLLLIACTPTSTVAQATAFSQILPKFVGTGQTTTPEQGAAVGLSSDGNTAIVGTRGLPFPGGAWILVRSSGVWSAQALLQPNDSNGYAYFGITVAISSNGNTAAIGGTNDQFGAGAVWVFTRSGTTWSQQGTKLVATGNVGVAALGTSLSISSDGNTVVAGGMYDNSTMGAAFVFRRTGTTWAQQAKLVGTGAVGFARMGFVAISGDGNTAALGGIADNSTKGAVWVFVQSGGAWTQQGSKLVPTGTNEAIGSALSLSFDGNTLAMSGVGENIRNNAVWIFVRSISTWSQQAKIVPTDLPGVGAVEFGKSVSLSSDGSILVAGSPEDDLVGGLRVFKRSGSTWTQQGNKVVGTGFGVNSIQGECISISGDGTTIAVGSFFDNRDVGATWFFTLSGSTVTQQGSKMVLDDGGKYSFGFGTRVAIAPNGLTAVASSTLNHFYLGGVWVFVRASLTSSWTQQQTIIPEITEINDSPEYGSSVTLSSDGNILAFGAPGYGFKGAVYIYTRSGGVWTQEARLIGTTTQVSPGPDQGTSVALSDAGTTVVFGSPEDGSTGCIFIFNRTGTTWTERASKLVGSGSVGSLIDQGRSVAISGDATTIASGGPGDNSDRGAVWIFTRTGSGTYTEQTKLTDPDPKINAQFGYSVALSSDGNVLAVGCYSYTSPGATLIFTRSGSSWTFKQRLVGTGAVGHAGQGYTVDLSSDGKLVVIGGKFDNNQVGAVWAFSQGLNGTYVQQGSKMVSTDGVGQQEFGITISLSATGKSLIVGAPGDDSYEGAVFSFDPTTFTPTKSPTKSPSRSPTPPTTMTPTSSPSVSRPTSSPTFSQPTQSPSRSPTSSPTLRTANPTQSPTPNLAANSPAGGTNIALAAGAAGGGGAAVLILAAVGFVAIKKYLNKRHNRGQTALGMPASSNPGFQKF